MRREMSEEEWDHFAHAYEDSAMTQAEMRQVRIDDTIYDLESRFGTDYLVECLREAEEKDLQDLNQAIKDADAFEALALLRRIKDLWIREYAIFRVDDR